MENTKQKLTPKQREFLKEYLESGNATEAAMKAYHYTDKKLAAKTGFRNLKKLQITEEIDYWLVKKGLTDEKLADKIMELVDNKKDWRAVADGLTKIMRLKGYDKQKVEVGTDDETNVTMIVEKK